MTTKGFFIKLLQHLEIGHAVGNKRQIAPYDNLEQDELILWATIGEQYNLLLKERQWHMRDAMTPAKVEELRIRMRDAFRELMAKDVKRNDFDNLKITKQAYAVWQEAFDDLTKQYTLA